MAIEKIAISDLERTTLQTRVLLSADTVDDYAEAMRNRAKFPPVTVFADAEKDTLWLADGFHRVAAAEMDGYKFVKADVRAGTFADALKFALGANANHGLRRSNADKRKSLEMAWQNRRELWPRDDGADPSAAVLADACGISVRTVECFIAKIQPPQNVEVEPTQIAQVAPTRKTGAKPAPVRKKTPVPQPRIVFGKDGRTRNVPTPVSKPTAPQGGKATAYSHARGVMTDRFGVEIPMEIRDAFKAETARDEIENHLAQAARLLKRAMDDKDPSVAQFRQADLIDIQNAVRTAKFTRPWCVCRICQGNGRGSCTACHETGFQTEAQYENNPKEFKA